MAGMDEKLSVLQLEASDEVVLNVEEVYCVPIVDAGYQTWKTNYHSLASVLESRISEEDNITISGFFDAVIVIELWNPFRDVRQYVSFPNVEGFATIFDDSIIVSDNVMYSDNVTISMPSELIGNFTDEKVTIRDAEFTVFRSIGDAIFKASKQLSLMESERKISIGRGELLEEGRDALVLNEFLEGKCVMFGGDEIDASDDSEYNEWVPCCASDIRDELYGVSEYHSINVIDGEIVDFDDSDGTLEVKVRAKDYNVVEWFYLGDEPDKWSDDEDVVAFLFAFDVERIASLEYKQVSLYRKGAHTEKRNIPHVETNGWVLQPVRETTSIMESVKQVFSTS